MKLLGLWHVPLLVCGHMVSQALAQSDSTCKAGDKQCVAEGGVSSKAEGEVPAKVAVEVSAKGEVSAGEVSAKATVEVSTKAKVEAKATVEVSAKAPQKSPYYWPHCRGRHGEYGTSPYKMQRNLSSSLSWIWEHPEGRYMTMPFGSVIDDKQNIYLGTAVAIYKLDKEGNQIWKHDVEHSNTAAIDNGLLYSVSRKGEMFALSMETGHLVWNLKVSYATGPETACVGVHEGVFIAATDAVAFPDAGERKVVAVNATDGAFLWEYYAENQLWNFVPYFTDRHSFVFQDQVGGVYHIGLDGKKIWKSGYSAWWAETWTDGVPMLGPNNIVYAVHAKEHIVRLRPTVPGDLSAYALDDGKLLWRQELNLVPNCSPLVMRKNGKLQVVMPIGAQMSFTGEFLSLVGAAGGLYFGLIIGCAIPILFRIWRIIRPTFGPLLDVIAQRFGRRFSSERAEDEPVISFVLSFVKIVGSLGVLGAIIGALYVGVYKVYSTPDTSNWAASAWEHQWPAELRAYDAETGVEQWRFVLPEYEFSGLGGCRGDYAGIIPRLMAGRSMPICIPNPYSNAVADATGTIFFGRVDGWAYAINDANNDGVIDPLTEMTRYDMEAASNVPGVSVAPDIMVFATCDRVFGFKR